MRPPPLIAREYGDPIDLASALASSQSITRERAEHLLRRAGERIQRAIGGLKANPVELGSSGVRVKGVAGVIEIDSGIELEIAPKYASKSHTRWREDLLFLAMFCKYGELLAETRITAGSSAANDLSDLAAKVVLRMFYGNRRSPLRTRSLQRFESYEYETDIEPDDLLLPGDEGFRQKAYSFSRDNEFSATLMAGAAALLGRVRASPLRAQLARMQRDIGPQTARASKLRRRLPARLRHWQPLYDFCFELSRDSGLAPGAKGYFSPGFVLSTWQTWEDAIAKSLVLAFGSSVVRNKPTRFLGQRAANAKVSDVICVPDSVVTFGSDTYVVDAKYKGEADEGFDHITNADLYESLAFAKAANAKSIILVYPQTDDNPSVKTGDSYVAEVVTMGSVQVHALCIQLNGIAKPGGLLTFVTGLRSSIETIMKP